MFSIPAHLNAPNTPTSVSSNTKGGNTITNRLNGTSMNAAPLSGGRSKRQTTVNRSRSDRNVFAAAGRPLPILERGNVDRSRSARNVFAAAGRPLPILEREGSTRNFRELPDRRRTNSFLESSPSPAAPRGNLRGQRRSNSTRRFFVTDQSSRSSTAPTNNTSAAAAAATAASLGERLRRITLDRQDSSGSIESMQSTGESMRSLVSGSSSQVVQNHHTFNHNVNNHGSLHSNHSNNQSIQSRLSNNHSIQSRLSNNHSLQSHLSHGGDGYGNGGAHHGTISNNNAVNPNFHDSVTSFLSMDSMSLTSRAPASVCLSFGSANPDASFSGYGDDDDGESEDMMSLFSKDSLRVRQVQMQPLDSSSVFSSSFSRNSDHTNNMNHQASNANNNQRLSVADRLSLSGRADDDMLSVATESEVTLYSYDFRSPALSLVQVAHGAETSTSGGGQ